MEFSKRMLLLTGGILTLIIGILLSGSIYDNTTKYVGSGSIESLVYPIIMPLFSIIMIGMAILNIGE